MSQAQIEMIKCASYGTFTEKQNLKVTMQDCDCDCRVFLKIKCQPGV